MLSLHLGFLICKTQGTGLSNPSQLKTIRQKGRYWLEKDPLQPSVYPQISEMKAYGA